MFQPQEFADFLKEAKKAKKPPVDLILEKNLVPEEYLAQKNAEFLKVPFVDVSQKNIRKDILFLITEATARENQILAFDKTNEGIMVGLVEPDNLETIEFLKKAFSEPVIIHAISKIHFKLAIKQYKRGLKIDFKEIIEKSLESSRAANDNDEAKLAEDLPVIEIVDTVLEHAIYEGASDIHMEPMEKEVIIRFRVDGILHDIISMPKEVMAGVVARIKVLANLKIDEHRLPQDGRFKLQKEDYKVSFRTSILPTYDGEKIVLRLLNESNQILTLEQLGFQHSSLKLLKANVKKPHGMILVTGPTGSGKTTTLYSVLDILNTPKVNISTVEDPIEYRVERINQSQVNAKIGFSFANGLRTLVRQDPDIIMVGEIRDNETAEISVHAALTGHLVLSTLHTNDAPGAIARLFDMGIKPFLIASTLNIIIGQRLVRKTCSECITSYMPDSKEIQLLDEQYDLDEIMEIMKREKITEPNKKFEDLKFFKGKGCNKCNNTGYKGRIGIYEVMSNDTKIQNLTTKKATSDELLEVAKAEGMITMVQDGFIKAKTGVTTLEEIIRVTKE
ncbi:MAG: GspE/PulE family protein [bacterium]